MTDIDLNVQALQAQIEGVQQELEQLQDDLSDADTVFVGTAVEYAIYLEAGTSKMDPKPFFRPALAEVRVEGVDGFLRSNTETTVEDIDTADELVRTLAFALERRIKEIITAKGLIDTGTLRFSIAAVPAEAALATAADVPDEPPDNPLARHSGAITL